LAAVFLVTGLTASLEAHAQFSWDQQYQYKRSRPQSGGFFRNFFEPFNSHQREDEYYAPAAAAATAATRTAGRKSTRPITAQNGIKSGVKSRLDRGDG
jgi:hypothetical protein